MRLLSVVIPSYNTELYLSRCLDSILYDEAINKLLDVIIVNDGSSDDTLDIAKRYQKEFPNTITIIDKANGGHGSTVNAGLEVAQGKYFKVIDADDWVNVAEFGDFVNTLENVEDDIVATSYQRDILYDSSIIEFEVSYNNHRSTPIREITNLIDDENFFFMFSMHSMTVKTSALRKVWGDGLLERTFYVDQQYVVKVLECTKTFCTLDFDIYRYFIGRSDQSVSVAGFFKHRQDHERVLRWLLKELGTEKVQKHQYLVDVLTRQIEAMMRTHYEIYYQTLYATTEQLNELLSFDEFLQTNYPIMHSHIPAANRLKRRLSSWRRSIKRKLLTKQTGAGR